MPADKLSDLINSLGKDASSLREQVAEICIYSQGAVDYNTAWGISFQDRETLVKIINKKNKQENGSTKEYM